ncbi:Retrovirus-related Pol polyprotein from transposon TNT 1-94 [Senna tora]|uniref:Retrovirus-related Pol polyprotein from transposon TNT 1-94 n=1 Tax=Senna tora TaxID=362788 RepID=A0A834TNP2_9FABA|nr:Retrovirus-related Pol polyprotein from transposon TNT 1-94 [Senna tora]
MREHHGDRVIIIADNSTYPVVKEGVVTIDVADTTRGIKLNDVYHVPGLTKNLVSVPQITDSKKYVLFGPNDVKVLDNVNNVSADVILTRKKKGSLFVMSAREAYVKKTGQTDSVAIWHARLGHVGYQMLQQISSKKLVDGMPTLKNVHECVICQGCQYGKSHRLPFKRKGWRCIDPETKQYTTSRDVVFDEVSSLFSAQKVVTLGDDQDNLEMLFPEGALTYEEAKGCPNWEKAMQEEIEALTKNETWELVPKPENNAQVADIFTTALVKPKFQFFRDALGVIDLSLNPSAGVKIAAEKSKEFVEANSNSSFPSSMELPSIRNGTYVRPQAGSGFYQCNVDAVLKRNLLFVQLLSFCVMMLILYLRVPLIDFGLHPLYWMKLWLAGKELMLALAWILRWFALKQTVKCSLKPCMGVQCLRSLSLLWLTFLLCYKPSCRILSIGFQDLRILLTGWLGMV